MNPIQLTLLVAFCALLAAAGVMQLDNFNDEFVVVLQRMPSGKLDLVSLSVGHLAL